jgi:hypothetical protein
MLNYLLFQIIIIKKMYQEKGDQNIIISMGKKLYEERDYPEGTKIISEDREKGIIQQENSWKGEIKGFNLFPDGNLQGSGFSFVHNNGVSISHWQGTFATKDNNIIIPFKGRDINKNGRFIVLRTFFSNSYEFLWMDGLVCIAEGKFDSIEKCFISSGYEWTSKIDNSK